MVLGAGVLLGQCVVSGLKFGAGKNAWRFGDIDKTRRQELSKQIAERIREAIADGAWRQGERLPGSCEIARRYGVTEWTVRAALRVLVAEDVVRRGPATVGYFVRGGP